MQTQEPKQREDWRRRREKYLRESGRHIELMKEGYECGDSSKDWAVIVGRGGRVALERHALGARLFLVRTDVHGIHVKRKAAARITAYEVSARRVKQHDIDRFHRR